MPPSKTKNKPSKAIGDHRQSSRKNVKLLVAFRCNDANAPIQDGFARAVSLSQTGALLELPDLYQLGNEFKLEFLLDNNFIAPVQGTVVRIDKRKDFYEVGVEFTQVPTKVKRLIDLQTKD